LSSGGQTIVQNQGITDTYVHADGSAGTTDGQIDFIYTNIPVGATSTQNIVRTIRWYGLPRGTTNNATVNAGNGDVAPLRDVLYIASQSKQLVTAAQNNIPVNAPFEKPLQLPLLVNNTRNISSDYAAQTPTGPAPTALGNGAQYICAWGPNDPKPKMIRITMTIDDPGGRLGDGQTYEYIYTLP
jgi:hypothetical protein